MTELVEKALDAILPAADKRQDVLSQAMRWAVMGGGKRIRPKICMMAAVAAGGSAKDALLPACAIELLHSYTLVHDDLPAMDNDVERRGRPSVWAKFGEANAILAGDALQALAFEVAARSVRNASAVTASLARAAVAVVEGQAEDLKGFGEFNGFNGFKAFKGDKSFNDFNGFKGDKSFNGFNGLKALNSSKALNQLESVFEKKTAALFAAAAEMGALAVGADAAIVAKLCAYGRDLGMAFQYEDDLLDGDDGAFSSLTILGRDEVECRITAHTSSAISSLAGLPGDTAALSSLASSLIARSL